MSGDGEELGCAKLRCPAEQLSGLMLKFPKISPDQSSRGERSDHLQSTTLQ